MFEVHTIFDVSVLIKYHGDGDCIIILDPKLIYKELSYKEERNSILDKDVRMLRL